MLRFPGEAAHELGVDTNCWCGGVDRIEGILDEAQGTIGLPHPYQCPREIDQAHRVAPGRRSKTNAVSDQTTNGFSRNARRREDRIRHHLLHRLGESRVGDF
jgi:hypothetical protein